MARSKESKKVILTGLNESIEKSTSIVFANLKGLKVKHIEQLRKALRAESIDCIVAKKTLLTRAFADSGMQGLDFKGMDGEIATVFSYGDQVAPARIIHTLSKQLEQLGILAGLLREQGGVQILTGAQIKALALLPSRDELRAKLVGTLAAPMSGFVGVLNGSLRSLVQLLGAYAESKS